MTKSIIRCLCALMALLMLVSAAAMAETETKTYKTYEQLDAQRHTVYEETWIYPVINGTTGSGRPAGDSHLGSGKPAGSDAYEEAHTFENGVCIYCGYAAETFTNAMGVVLAKGMPAADALKQVFAAMPANANMKIVGAAANEGDELVKLVNNAAKPDTFTTPLAAFTAETVDNVPCNIVTLNYADDEDNPITENYAFSTADTTLVKLY